MTTLDRRTDVRPCAARYLIASDDMTPSGPRSLAQAVQASVRATDERTLCPVARHDAGLAFQRKTLLALLSYCYARQIYGSAHIEDDMARDAKFRQLCHDEFPDAGVLRRFRRENREAVRLCLTEALGFLAEQKVEEGLVTKVSPVHCAEEATRRMTMAMFIDSMELDDN